MRTCAEYEELISALLDGELTAEEQTEVEAHIASCPQCKAMYDAFAAVSVLETEELPENLHTDIMNKVGMARKAAKTQGTIIRLRPILTSVACLVVIVGTLFAFSNSLRMGSAEKSAAPAAPAAAEPKMSMTAADSAEVEMYYGDMAPAEPAAPAAPAAPAPPAAPAAPDVPAEPGASADTITERAENVLSSVVLEVISVTEDSIEARDFKVGGTLSVQLTEETEISDEVRRALGPGCTITVMYDLLQAEADLEITAVKVTFAE